MPEVPGKKPKKTVTASFRVDEESFGALQEEAKRRMVSVNTLVNQLLMVYAKHDRFLSTRVLKFPDRIFRMLLDLIPEDEIERFMSQLGKDLGKGAVNTLYGEFNLTNILRLLENNCLYGEWGAYNERQLQGGKLMVKVEHNVGKKGSIMIGAYQKALLEEAGLKPKVTMTESAVIIEI